jgi:hypothetical protein
VRPSSRALAAATLVLAGCATGVPVERQVVVSGERFSNVQGEADLLVRTFLPGTVDGDRREVVGARCDVVSSLYRTALVTPARLVVPNFGPQSPDISVTCLADDLAGTGTVAIVTRWNRPPGYWGYPGAVWDPWPGYGWGWPGYAVPVSNYPDLFLEMRRQPPQHR